MQQPESEPLVQHDEAAPPSLKTSSSSPIMTMQERSAELKDRLAAQELLTQQLLKREQERETEREFMKGACCPCSRTTSSHEHRGPADADPVHADADAALSHGYRRRNGVSRTLASVPSQRLHRAKSNGIQSSQEATC
ncbi:hypothetical protein GQ600_4131 [Phytophthora cactorum]|nr:hypothetical protein GQ600_4131 [Phytophthora cactorum]